MDQQRIQAWLKMLAQPEGLIFRAPEDWPGWTDRPWVRLRPLTWREGLLREALACWEEFEIDEASVVRRVIRRYDPTAARRFELEHCLTGFCLPLPSAEGQAEPWEPEEINEEVVERLLAELPLPLGGWLEQCLDEVNLRSPQDQELLQAVKKR